MLHFVKGHKRSDSSLSRDLVLEVQTITASDDHNIGDAKNNASDVRFSHIIQRIQTLNKYTT